VSEVVQAFHSPEVLLKLKASDVAPLVSLAAALHRRYESFTEPLIAGLTAAATDDSAYRALGSSSSGNAASGGGSSGSGGDCGDGGGDGSGGGGDEFWKKKRAAVRLLAELWAIGVHEDGHVLVRSLRRAFRGTAGPKKAAAAASEAAADLPSANQMDQATVASVGKWPSGLVEEVTGRMSRKGQLLVEEHAKYVKEEEEEEESKKAAKTGAAAEAEEGDGSEKEKEKEGECSDPAAAAAAPAPAFSLLASSAALRETLDSALEILSTALVVNHKALRKLAQKMEKDELTHGTLAEEKQQLLGDAKRQQERLYTHVSQLCEACGGPGSTGSAGGSGGSAGAGGSGAVGDGSSSSWPPPHLATPFGASGSLDDSDDEDGDDEDGTGGLSLWAGLGGEAGGGGAGAAGGPFGDEETRHFYTSLPDLLSSVPAKVLGLSEQDAAELKERRLKLKEQGLLPGEEGGDEDGGGSVGGGGEDDDLDLDLVQEGGGNSGDDKEGEDDEGGGEDDDDDHEDDDDGEEGFGTFDAVAEAAEKETKAGASSASSSGGGASAAQRLLACLTSDLPMCHNRDKTDSLVMRLVELQGCANKGFRKRLVEELAAVPRQRLDLLPQ
jgi:hypothetical protein